MKNDKALPVPDQSKYTILLRFPTFEHIFNLYQIFDERSISKPIKSKLTCEYTERMRRKWEEKQMKRQMKALLTLKRFDLEKIAQHIKPEKDRIAYNRAKKRAIEENFQKVHHEISEIRARLLPQKDVDQEAERLDFIKNNVDNLLSSDLDGFRYDLIETELKEKVCCTISFMIFVSSIIDGENCIFAFLYFLICTNSWLPRKKKISYR